VEPIAAALLAWIAAHSSYAVADLAPPPVRLLDPAALRETLQVGESALAGANGVWGLYRAGDGPAGTIYLLRPEDTPGADRHAQPADNPVFRERLLHELVHFAQHRTGAMARFNCVAEGERDAYRLGARWLQQQGVRDPLPNRKFVMFVQSSCAQ
jgi:hypothetical protein